MTFIANKINALPRFFAVLTILGSALVQLVPGQVAAAEPSPATLDHILFSVNDQKQLVRNGETLMVVAGDGLVVEEAFLTNGLRPSNVNVVGYVPRNPAFPAEDRGYKIDSGRDFMPYWAIDELKQRYRVDVFTGKSDYGTVFIEVLPPKLQYVLLSVNGQPRVARPGQLLRLDAEDSFKVERIVSNVVDEKKPITMEMRAISAGVDLPGVRFFEMTFARDRVSLARIPVQVEGI